MQELVVVHLDKYKYSTCKRIFRYAYIFKLWIIENEPILICSRPQ